MRIDPDDRKTAAGIRDTAMGLFAARGVAGVTVRQIASAAGVSPGLVMHHFGSKEGLKEAVDQKAARVVEDLLGDVTRLGEEGGSGSRASVFADRLEDEPAWPSTSSDCSSTGARPQTFSSSASSRRAALACGSSPR